MATESIPRQSHSHRSLRSVLRVGLALLVGAGIGAGMVALVADGSPETRAATLQRAAGPSDTDARRCPGDGGALLATVMSMPPDVASDVADRLSPTTRALLHSAAEQSAITRTRPGPPDTATLAAALSRLGPTDSDAVMSGLLAETRAALPATVDGSCR
jgi:hypothetical protein